jgi:hypothetical protein
MEAEARKAKFRRRLYGGARETATRIGLAYPISEARRLRGPSFNMRYITGANERLSAENMKRKGPVLLNEFFQAG